MRKLILSQTFVLLFCFSSFGQADKWVETAKQPESKNNGKARREASQEAARLKLPNKSLENLLPEGANAWVAQIVTTGGIMGTGLPTLTIKSNGDISQDDETAAKKILPAEALQTLREIITSVYVVEGEKLSADLASEDDVKLPDFLCNDCYQTQIFIARREADGSIKKFSDTTKANPLTRGDFNRIKQIITRLPHARN